MNNLQLAIQFFPQIAVILLACRVVTTLMASPIFERLVGSGDRAPKTDG